MFAAFAGAIGIIILVTVVSSLGIYLNNLRKQKNSPGENTFIVGIMLIAPGGEYSYLQCWGYIPINPHIAIPGAVLLLSLAGVIVMWSGISAMRQENKGLRWQIECLNSPDKPSLS